MMSRTARSPSRPFAWFRVDGAIIDGARREGRAASIDRALLRGLEDFSETPRGEGDYNDSDEKVKHDYESAADDLAESLFFAACLAARKSPEEQYVEREVRARLDGALEALPDPHRHVIVQRYHEDREMDDIARELGKSSAAVRRLRADAEERLRRLLAADGVLELKKAGGSR